MTWDLVLYLAAKQQPHQGLLASYHLLPCWAVRG
jgi:hypothetical protein